MTDVERYTFIEVPDEEKSNVSNILEKTINVSTVYIREGKLRLLLFETIRKVLYNLPFLTVCK